MIEIIDEDTIRSSDWGIVRFKPAPKGKNGQWICRHCLFLRSMTDEECAPIPCRSGVREDKLNGYFTIQPLPIEPLFTPSAFE